MADKVSDFIEKGLVLLNNKKARYDIHKVEQQTVDKTNTQVTVISYKIFPETTVKIDADAEAAVTRQHYYRNNSKTVKIACFLGGALVAIVLITGIFAICLRVMAPKTTIAPSYYLHLPGDYQLEVLTLYEIQDVLKRLRNYTGGAFPSPQPQSNCPKIIAESGSINLNRSNEYSEETILARELSAISTSQTNRFNKPSANLVPCKTKVNEEQAGAKLLETKSTEFLTKYKISITDALNWFLWMEQNLPTCLTDVAPFSNFSSTTSAAPAEENSESDEEPDSDEDVPNEN